MTDLSMVKDRAIMEMRTKRIRTAWSANHHSHISLPSPLEERLGAGFWSFSTCRTASRERVVMVVDSILTGVARIVSTDFWREEERFAIPAKGQNMQLLKQWDKLKAKMKVYNFMWTAIYVMTMLLFQWIQLCSFSVQMTGVISTTASTIPLPLQPCHFNMHAQYLHSASYFYNRSYSYRLNRSWSKQKYH